ncbi:MAG: nucleoside hydrolase-like domain-containing protein [Verrucomicrobiota bacterium]
MIHAPGIIFCSLLATLLSASISASERDRVIILADMGNEPDEEQQMVHMLMCSNEFELEGLIAVTGKFLRPESKDPYKRELHPELFHELISEYAKVVKNLRKHADGWHSPKYLRSIVTTGQTGYGIASVGEGLSSPGSELIIRAAEKKDPRPLHIVVNAGSNTLAQALFDYERTHTDEEMDQFISKLIVYENGAQDDAGAAICHKYPGIHWIRSNYQTYCYGGPSWEGQADKSINLDNLGPHTWKPYEYSPLGQHQWLLENVIGNHGRLGAKYPLRSFWRGQLVFMEGGGTVPWLSFVSRGLGDLRNPHWGGWSGRFTKEKAENIWSKHADIKEEEQASVPFKVFVEAKDTWADPETGIEYRESLFAPVWRWRRAIQNNLQCRMDWCVEDFEDANHHPIAVLDGDRSDRIIKTKVSAGDELTFDASESFDPDGDALEIGWWLYQEAGSYKGAVPLERRDESITIKVPEDAAESDIHLILEVRDKNKIAELYDYRRVVITVD